MRTQFPPPHTLSHFIHIHTPATANKINPYVIKKKKENQLPPKQKAKKTIAIKKKKRIYNKRTPSQ